MERYKEIVSPSSGGGSTLLGVTYTTILEDTAPQEEIMLVRFCFVMQQVMLTFEPQQLDVLNEMRAHFPSEEDHFIIVILEFMDPMLGGIADRLSVVWPLHASFYNFLTDHSQSRVYFLGVSTMHDSLAYASLHTLCNVLKFDICGLERSYLLNSGVTDLQERIHKH